MWSNTFDWASSLIMKIKLRSSILEIVNKHYFLRTFRLFAHCQLILILTMNLGWVETSKRPGKIIFTTIFGIELLSFIFSIHDIFKNRDSSSYLREIFFLQNSISQFIPKIPKLNSEKISFFLKLLNYFVLLIIISPKLMIRIRQYFCTLHRNWIKLFSNPS